MIGLRNLKKIAKFNNSMIVFPPKSKKIFSQIFDNNDELFEYEEIKRIKPTKDSVQNFFKTYYPNSYHNLIYFQDDFNIKTTPTGASNKNVVIKNIGDMKIPRLVNALNYAIKKSTLNNKALTEFFELKGLAEILHEWKYDFNWEKEYNEGMHLVFCIDEERTYKNLSVLQMSVWQTMKDVLDDYKFALIPHVHQNKPHVHVILNKNSFSGKKLHFNKKNDIKDLFFNLRESFKNNLFLFSNGSLDYNNPRPKSFLEKKIENLETTLEKIQNPPQQEDFNELKYKPYLSNVYKSIKRNISSLETKNLKLWKKINNFPDEENRSYGENLFFNKLLKEILSNQKKIERSKMEINTLLEIEDNYTNFFYKKSELDKKKTILSFFSQVNPQFLDKKTLESIKKLSKEIKKEEVLESESLKELSTAIINDESAFINEKQNLFVLSKKLKIIKDTLLALDKDTSLNNDSKVALKQRLLLLEEKFFILIKQRKDYLNQRENALKNDLENEENELIKKRKKRSLEFIEKEKYYEKDFLAKTNSKGIKM